MIYPISDALYAETLDRLIDAIGSRSYFSGVLTFPHHDLLCRLVLSVCVYRRTERLPEGDTDRVADLVPVWWEFHTLADDGTEHPNDFSFGELRDRLR